ncbi:predicted protein [Naegleria gruberi]|uniref:Predicted protein n=1 Tax=Naegleria gruberi TaxID=5762 RepID=D2VXT4_NAEGR|nr:uncharacterized protein NAEGRDRAFT_73866 [Naegleria gruberi]EFC38394.1 predicted protein [Naegleria gruberi]|eukprot:XP_002671138.1 predicted protein [Naegleria gruberi strain NEG-M]
MAEIPTTQKQYRLQHFEGTHGLTLFPSEPVETPQRKQVLVRLHAASLNFRDILISRGQFGSFSFPPGLIPLSDGAGQVVALGDEVTSFQIGDRVCGTFFETWQDGPITPDNVSRALGATVPGVLAQYRVFEESALIKFPSHLSYEQASTLPCAAVTAWSALNENGVKAGPGETVLIIGTGGVSLFGLQFAVRAGCQVMVLSSSDEKLKLAQSLGASFLINYKKHPDWEIKVREITNGKGVDHVLEVGGEGTLNRSLDAVRLGGHVHIIGVLAKSAGTCSGFGEKVLYSSVQMRGIYIGSRGVFERMNKSIEINEIKPVVDRVFDFENVKEAFEYLASGKHFGKVVIRID